MLKVHYYHILEHWGCRTNPILSPIALHHRKRQKQDNLLIERSVNDELRSVTA